MTREDRLSNLMFLLTIPVAIGCATGGDDPTTSSPPMVNPTDPTTGGDDDDPTTTEPGATTNSGVDSNSSVDGPGMTTDEPGDATTEAPYMDTGYMVTGYMDTGYGECPDTMPPMVGPISEACMQYGPPSTECYFDGNPACIPVSEAYCQSAIDYNTMAYGPACGMAWEELFVCLSQVPCELLLDKMEDCPAQFMVIQMSCG